MRLNTDGLIIRETPVGEADKFVTLLTRERGLLRAAARKARQVNHRGASATRLLTHAQLSLQQGKSGWYIDDAHPLHVFSGLENDLERLALAQYFCELTGVTAPRDEPAGETLRLLLNALHFLSQGTRPAALIKAAVECRLLAGAGYAPDLSACARCGKTDGVMRFLPLEGQLLCDACGHGQGLPLSPAGWSALRRLTGGTLEQAFALRLSPQELPALAAAGEAFVLAQLGRGFATLDFYHTVHTGKDDQS